MKEIDSDLSIEQSAIFRIIESNRRSLERLIFRRHPNREWGTFFQFGYRRGSVGFGTDVCSDAAATAR